MPSATAPTLELSHIQASEVSKHQELRLRVSLDGNIQESQESTLNAGVHMWRELFSFDADSNSLCEIHVLAKKRKFFCCPGRYKAIRKTRLQSVGELLVTRSSNGVVRLPLYDSARTNGNGVIMGNVILLIADTTATKDTLKCSSTRDSVSCKDGSGETYLRSPSPEAIPSEKLSLVESESELSRRGSPPPRPMAPTPPTSPPSASPTHSPSYVPLQPPPSASHDAFTQQYQYLQPMSLLPQSAFVSPPPKPGVDRGPAGIETHGDAATHPKYVLSPGILSSESVTAASSLIGEDMSGLAPRGPSDVGSFAPVICEPPEDVACEGSAGSWFPVPPHTTELAMQTLPAPLEVSEPTTLPQISITLARSSRSNSPLAPSCESDVTIKRPNVHVNTGSATQALNVGSTLSPGFVDEPSPYSHSLLLVSPQPATSTTNTSSSDLSPFSRTSMSLGTAVTTPAQSAASERSKGGLPSAPGSPAKQRKERPTIDTSCVGPRGQVRQYRNGSVPPVHVPVKLRNASLDLSRCNEYEKFGPNPSMYSIAPSISPRHFRSGGESRCPSSQPASRQGFIPSTRAPSVRREPLEYDEGQICLDTANLGDQEVATFLKEVDAALSAVVNGSPAVAAEGRAFLSVPSANSRLVSRHQSRKPSSQQLRADLSATIRSHEKEGAARTGFSLVARSHASPHPDVIPSRVASPLSGQTDTIPRLYVSQVGVTSSSKPASPSRGAIQVPSFLAPQRVSPQPSSRQELAVEWAPPALVSSATSRTKEPMQLTPAVGLYNGNVDGNETTT
ncbi:hypothetical protein BS17DRAFT_814064 [Gyrodon lividus]|nr:hypothetical protein BS17DRAFT_814064 [Gyrodon lividus]